MICLEVFLVEVEAAEVREEAGEQEAAILRVKIKVNYEEIAKGTTKTIKVKKYISAIPVAATGAKDKNSAQTCRTCGGNGQVRRVQNTFLGQMQTVTTCPDCNGEGSVITSKCTTCKGEGRVYGEETVTLGYTRWCTGRNATKHERKRKYG